MMTPPFSLIAAWTFSIALMAAVVLAALNQPSAEEGMAFYGSYHQNGWNQLIHFFGVPSILFSAIVFACHLQIPAVQVDVDPDGNTGLSLVLPKHSFSMGTFLLLFYLTYYLLIDPVGGILFGPVLVAMYATGVRWVAEDRRLACQKKQKTDDATTSPPVDNNTHNWMGTGAVLKWALLVQLASWYAQIHPGHAILEGAKPALLDSLGASFSSAPLFAFYEGVWFLGFRTDLRDKVQELVRQHTQELCRGAGAAMRVCLKQ